MTLPNLDELATPTILIDKPRMIDNIQSVHERSLALGLSLRVNVSLHGVLEIAQLQIDAGAKGISCYTVEEARQFIEAGFTNMQVPSNIVGVDKTEALTDLLMMARVTVTADHPMVVAGLADATERYDLSARVLVEIRSDHGRTGLSPAEAVTLAQRIEDEEHLHFAGIYMQPITAFNYPALQSALKQLDEAGLGVDVVSGGGTGFTLLAMTMPDVTEIVAGRYVFYDWESVVQGWCHPDECSLMLRTTVTHRPSPETAMLNVGWRTLSANQVNGIYGHILEYPHAVIQQLDAERAYIDTSRCTEQPVIGEIVHLIPVHAGAAIRQARQVYTVDDGKIEDVWNVMQGA